MIAISISLRFFAVVACSVVTFCSLFTGFPFGLGMEIVTLGKEISLQTAEKRFICNIYLMTRQL
jgi:hypothetical protein